MSKAKEWEVPQKMTSIVLWEKIAAEIEITAAKTYPCTDKNAAFWADLYNVWLKSLQSSNINE